MKLHQKESKDRLNEFVVDIIDTTDAQELLTADGLYNVISGIRDKLIHVADSFETALSSIKMFKDSLFNAQKDLWDIRTEKVQTLQEIYKKNQAAENLSKILLNTKQKAQYEEKLKTMNNNIKLFNTSQQKHYKEVTTDILRDEMKDALDNLKEIFKK